MLRNQLLYELAVGTVELQAASETINKLSFLKMLWTIDLTNFPPLQLYLTLLEPHKPRSDKTIAVKVRYNY